MLSILRVGIVAPSGGNLRGGGYVGMSWELIRAPR
jgi:hypothetical protein